MTLDIVKNYRKKKWEQMNNQQKEFKILSEIDKFAERVDNDFEEIETKLRDNQKVKDLEWEFEALKDDWHKLSLKGRKAFRTYANKYYPLTIKRLKNYKKSE